MDLYNKKSYSCAASSSRQVPTNSKSIHIKSSRNMNKEATLDDFQQVSKPRKKLSKNVRRVKREERALKELYAPKDTHIQLISPAILQLIKQDTNPYQSSRPKYEPNKSNPIAPVQASTRQNCEKVNSLKDSQKSSSSSSAKDETAAKAENIRVIRTFTEFPALSTKKKFSSPIQVISEGSEDVNADETLIDTETITKLTAVKKRSKKKPSKNQMFLDLGELLNNTRPSRVESKSNARKEKSRKRNVTTEIDRQVGQRSVGNVLDSSGLTFIHKGKIRQRPKRKRLSKLKQAIILSRSLRKLKLNESVDSDSDKEVTEVNETHVTTNPESSNEPACPENKNPESINSLPSGSIQQEILRSPVEYNVKVKSADEEEDNIFRKLLDEALETNDSNSGFRDTDSLEMLYTSELLEQAKMRLHSRRFRPYCDMLVNKAFHGIVIELLKELHRFQDRLYHSDQVKFKVGRRYVHGFKDVLIHLRINKVKLLIIAPDIESNDSKGGLDEKIDEVLTLAKNTNVPYVFSGNRFILGKPIYIKNPISVIGIINKQGAEELVKKLLHEASILRNTYTIELKNKAEDIKHSKNC